MKTLFLAAATAFVLSTPAAFAATEQYPTDLSALHADAARGWQDRVDLPQAAAAQKVQTLAQGADSSGTSETMYRRRYASGQTGVDYDLPMHPIIEGHNVQPRDDRLKALGYSDLTSKEADEVNRLYRQLMHESVAENRMHS